MQLHSDVWARIAELVDGIVSDPHFAELNQQYADAFGAGGTEPDGSGRSVQFEDALRFLRGAAICGRRYLDEVVVPGMKQLPAVAGAVEGGVDPASIPQAFPAFLAAAAGLHNAIYFLAGSLGVAAQTDIVALCESVWMMGLPGCESVVPALIPYVLVRSLQADTARESDVRRVHALRHALELLDVEDESFSSIKEFVLLAYRSPLYLKVTEGRRFLSFALCLHPQLVPDIHGVIKSNLPGSPAKVGVPWAFAV